MQESGAIFAEGRLARFPLLCTRDVGEAADATERMFQEARVELPGGDMAAAGIRVIKR